MAERVSVVVTTFNEAANLPHLLDSLAQQKGLRDVVLVDSESTDGTVRIAERYEEVLPLKIVVEKTTRGEGRNRGITHARGELVAFTDGDCIANAFWVPRLEAAWDGDAARVVAGRTVLLGYWAFTRLHRVELPHRGQDTTWPSANLAYPRTLLQRLGGFDSAFVTAEDIDLNLRAVDAGAQIVHVPDAIVYAKARESITGFLRQAYWNGYGRKQLTRKHGRLWSQYAFSRLLRKTGIWSLARMGAGMAGYAVAKLRGGRHPDRAIPPPGQEAAS